MRAKTTRRGRARGGAALLLLGLVATQACTTASTRRYRELERDWSRSETGADPVDAGEHLFEGAVHLDRRALIERVLERNPTVRAARYAWRAALARYPQVTALEDPTLGVGVAPLSFGSNEVEDAEKFDLSQRFPFPGKLRLRGEAALGEAEAASHDLGAVQLRLATLASLLFDDYYVAARSLELNAEHIALLEDFQRIATARYEAGAASQQDPIQAETELTHAQHREILYSTTLRVTAEQINALLRRAPQMALPPPPARAELPEALDLPIDQLRAQALAAHPELAAAGARITAGQARVALARREYFPDVTLVGAYDRLRPADDLQPFVGIQLSVPLQLGRRRAALEEAEARLEQVRSERTALEDEVLVGVESAADRLAEAHHEVHFYGDRLLPAARDRVEAARAGFETGRNSFLALIDAERNLRDVELAYEQTLANVSRRRAELDRARGRVPALEW